MSFMSDFFSVIGAILSAGCHGKEEAAADDAALGNASMESLGPAAACSQSLGCLKDLMACLVTLVGLVLGGHWSVALRSASSCY